MLLALLGLALPADASSRSYSWDDALRAIREVETGGLPDHGRGAVGDGGKALGPFQIHAAYGRTPPIGIPSSRRRATPYASAI